MRLLLQRFESERGERAGARECLPTELLLRGSELLPGERQGTLIIICQVCEPELSGVFDWR